MKVIRKSALILALGAFSICAIPAHAQQEVDPDHYDRPFPAPKQSRVARKRGTAKRSRGANQRQHARNMRQQRRRSG
jgi:hypothetical protein